MRFPICIMTLMLAASLLPGEEKPESVEAAIIPVKTLTGDSFNRLAKLLGVFTSKGSSFVADEKLRTIVVYAPKDVIAQMRRVVEQLDQPGSEAAIGRNIEMMLTFLRCSTTAQADARPLPPDLEAAAKQLRAATQYKNVQLWEMVPLHIQEGKLTEHSFRLPGNPGVPSAVATANLRIFPEAVSRKDSGRYVRFASLDIRFRVPHVTASFLPGPESAGIKQVAGTQINYFDVLLNTAGDFKEGQKTVLGKMSGLDDESAIFVVISLKVLD
jgi:hypothetical protein